MIYVEPPDMRVEDTLTASCAGLQDASLKKRMLTRGPDLSAAEKAYKYAAEHDGLYAFALARQITQKLQPDPESEELRNLYSEGLVGRKEGRVKYDELKVRAPFGRCLLCGNSEIASLDHHLPKDALPLYAICPANLVPACSKCNQVKGNRIGTTATQRTLHPYYDRPGGAGRYLFADVQSWPVRFRVQPLAEWSVELSQRVAHHFRVFNLAQRYAEFSISPLTGNQWLHQKIWREGGRSALADHLREDADQHKHTHGFNAWDTALRYGLAESDWYIDRGVNTNL